jgi:C4-dicarboxylate-specific signal transduction histidine kinase
VITTTLTSTSNVPTIVPDVAPRNIRPAPRAPDLHRHTSLPVDLNDVAEEVVALLRSELQKNQVVVRSELAEDLPLVMGDRVQLQQVVLNFLRNGSDAMTGVDDRRRDLIIRTEREEGARVRLSVKDVGVGFEPHAEEKLFESFYTTKKDGMGIGLSVSKSIIESHHGRLRAERNEGPGATFSFSIPYISEKNMEDGEGRRAQEVT